MDDDAVGEGLWDTVAVEDTLVEAEAVEEEIDVDEAVALLDAVDVALELALAELVCVAVCVDGPVGCAVKDGEGEAEGDDETDSLP